MSPAKTCSDRTGIRISDTAPTLVAFLIFLIAFTGRAAAYDDCPHRRPLDGTCSTYPYALGTSWMAPETKPALWEGLYIGGDLGGGVGGISTRGLTNGDVDIAGFTGGLHAGYDLLWNNVLLGVEFDVMRSGADGDRTFAGGREITSDVDWLSSSRFRLGYQTGDYLFYATAGLAYARQELQLAGPGSVGSDDEALFGYAIGGGVEMAVTESISARVEAIHYDFDEQTFNIANDRIEADADVTTVRAGISFHFN